MKYRRSKSFVGVNLRYVQQATGASGRVILDCDGCDLASVSITQGADAWSTAVVTLKKSNSLDGPWVTLSGVSTLTSSAPFSDPIAVSFRYLSPFVTTAEGSDSFVTIDISAQG